MYTVPRTRPLNPISLAIIKALHDIAARHQASYFIIGATARDILMGHVFGIAPGRATRDVDFAIALEDWPQFDAIKAALVGRGDFSSPTAEPHRLYYLVAEHGRAYPIDLIPFGKIATPGNTIAWPPDMAIIMNVTGYKEALKHALNVDIGNALVVNVVSIPALAALKLMAWNERGLADNKDAQDLLFIMRNYHDAGNTDRLFGEALALMESCGFDIELAGAALLGYDIRLMAEVSTREAMLDVLMGPGKRDRLTVHMSSALRIDPAIPTSLLDQFERGLQLDKL
jgi:predicted nucleotidyltransferase